MSWLAPFSRSYSCHRHSNNGKIVRHLYFIMKFQHSSSSDVCRKNVDFVFLIQFYSLSVISLCLKSSFHENWDFIKFYLKNHYFIFLSWLSTVFILHCFFRDWESSSYAHFQTQFWFTFTGFMPKSLAWNTIFNNLEILFKVLSQHIFSTFKYQYLDSKYRFLSHKTFPMSGFF